MDRNIATIVEIVYRVACSGLALDSTSIVCVKHSTDIRIPMTELYPCRLSEGAQ